MLTDRGYLVIKEEIPNIIIAKNNINKTIDDVILFYAINKLNTDVVKSCEEIIKEQGLVRGIIVCNNDITPKGKNIIDNINVLGDLYIEVFNATEFIFNKTKHYLVPKHILLSSTEATAIIKKYQKIPEILVTDPIIKYYGYKRDDIVKILRNNGEIYYRIII